MKKVLIVQPHEYYLFNYLVSLAPYLNKNNFDVSVYTTDSKVFEKFDVAGVKVFFFPKHLIYLQKLSDRYLIRPFSWFAFYLWSFRNRKLFDVAILPFDNKLIFLAIKLFIKSCTIHTTVNLVDLNQEVVEYQSHKNHSVVKFFERFLKIRIAPRFNGKIMKHNFSWYIDKIFGPNVPNHIQGFSGVDLITVTGKKIKSNLIESGLNELDTSIAVTGNPNYEGFGKVIEQFDNEKKAHFQKSLGLQGRKNIFTLFLSPSSFSEIQIKEILLVLQRIISAYPDCTLFLKFHPKTLPKFLELFEKRLSDLKVQFVISKNFAGDEFNLKLILISEAIFQKQSTVGFIAMQAKTPIISYNLFDTGYFDDLYEILDCSMHCKSIFELDQALLDIKNPRAIEKLTIRQINACDNFCKETNSPHQEITSALHAISK